MAKKHSTMVGVVCDEGKWVAAKPQDAASVEFFWGDCDGKKNYFFLYRPLNGQDAPIIIGKHGKGDRIPLRNISGNKWVPVDEHTSPNIEVEIKKIVAHLYY